MPEFVNFDKRQMVLPYLTMVGLFVAAIVTGKWWVLTGLPLIFLGWGCSVPNLNLANGFLVVVLFVICGLVSLAVGRLAMIPALFCGCCWVAFSLELLITVAIKVWLQKRK